MSLNADGLFLMTTFWGAAGAFIYAVPRWGPCVVTCWDTGHIATHCHLDFFISMALGTVADAEFTEFASAALPASALATSLRTSHALPVLVGLIANPATPLLVTRIPELLDRLFGKGGK